MTLLIDKKELLKFIDSLKDQFELIGPKKKGNYLVFDKLDSIDQLNMSNQTNYPAKKYFLPPEEVLFEYDGTKIDVNIDAPKRIMIIRPCDANAIANLDKVFLEENPDPYYKKRRENTLLFVFRCKKPFENCFCSSVQAEDTSNFDLLFTDIGDKYAVNEGSERVKDLIDKKKFIPVIRDGRFKLECTKKLVGTAKLKFNFDSKEWVEEANKCISCNACVSVCPSCFCYEVKDVPNIDLKSGKRVRSWSYCQMKDFTKVAGSHVFRSERQSRLKQRIYHQLKYFKDQHGKYQCVGCGRCIMACPAKIDMVDTVNSLP